MLTPSFIKLEDNYTPQYININSIVYAEEMNELHGEQKLFVTLCCGRVLTITHKDHIEKVKRHIESFMRHDFPVKP